MSNYGLEKTNGLCIAHTHKNMPIHLNAGGIYFVNVKNPLDNHLLSASLATRNFDDILDYIDQWFKVKPDAEVNVWVVRKYLPFMRKKKIQVKIGNTVTYTDGTDNKKIDQRYVLPEKFEVTQAYSNIVELYNKYKACVSKIKEVEREKAGIVDEYNREIDKISDMYFDVTTIELEA